MVNQTNLFRNIRWISVIAMLGIVIAGLLFPTSIVQALVYNPILLLVGVSVYGYADFQLDRNLETAQIHELPAPHSMISCRLSQRNSSDRAA